MQEIWKDIKGYEGLYQISNLGNVKSLRRKVYNHYIKERLLNPVIIKKGYLQIKLRKENNYKHFKVHRLVAQAFIPNPKNLPQVNHKDGDKTNNCVDNLEWVTEKENMRHAVKNNLLKDVSGNNNPNCKKVNQYDLQGNFIKQWNSFYEITKELGFNRHLISNCCNNRSKKSHGYIWRYANK